MIDEMMTRIPPQPSLHRYGVKAGDAVLAEDKHQPVYAELVKDYKVDYIAGGAGQNSIRVAQWMLNACGKPNSTAYFGCVGNDEYAAQMKAQAAGDGVNVQYMTTEEAATGTCAVLVTADGERSLIANLAAANLFKVAHLEAEASKAVIDSSSIFYITGFFLTVSCESIDLVGKHCVAEGKTLCMNLSAPFLVQFFGDQMMAAMPYVDIMFGNETEAAAMGEKMGWGTDIATIAKNIATLPKASGLKCRTVVITQGSTATVVVENGVATSHAVEPLAKELLVDTNGAGDAFVGGFLAQLAQGKSTADCVAAGHWAARVIIQRSGCSYPETCDYK